jgi:hypothetical protein
MPIRISIGGLLLLATATNGAVILVPEDQPSIQAGINIAIPGDMVSVAAGVYEEWLSFRGKDITVQSRDGATATTISGGDADSAMVFANGESEAAVLRGFTITGGGNGTEFQGLSMGAGIYIYFASPTIEDCIIHDCHAQMGGGVSIYQGNPVFRNVLLQGNTATLHGGGMRIHNLSHPIITDCDFIDNDAVVFGGGLAYGNDSNGIHEDCLFEGNSAGIRGGGLSKACDCSNAMISGTILCNNAPDHILGSWTDLGGNELCELCANDVTADGSVGVNDVLAVVAAWGGCICVEDINGDSVVNVDDLLLVMNAWGTCSDG